jgi:AraC-like DNA-binding protein
MLAEKFHKFESSATIRCGALSGIDAVLKRRGLNTPAVCEQAGVDPGVLSDPDLRFEVRRYVEFLESAARMCQDDELGLRLGYQQPLSTMGALSDMFLAAPDVKSAIRVGIDYMPMHQEGARLELSVEGGLAILSYSVRDPGLLEYRQDAELSVAKMLRFARAIARRSDWAPSAVFFEHPAPPDTTVHLKIFGAPVYFSQPQNGIAFPRELLQMRTAGGAQRNTPMPAKAMSLWVSKPQRDLLGELRLHVMRALRQGQTSIDECAAAFGLSRRTFQRRLSAEGVLFEQLVEGIRYELACHYLKQSHLSLTEIGYLLGYAELSSFSRAFRRWSGTCPHEFRRSQLSKLCAEQELPIAYGAQIVTLPASRVRN